MTTAPNDPTTDPDIVQPADAGGPSADPDGLPEPDVTPSLDSGETLPADGMPETPYDPETDPELSRRIEQEG